MAERLCLHPLGRLCFISVLWCRLVKENRPWSEPGCREISCCLAISQGDLPFSTVRGLAALPLPLGRLATIPASNRTDDLQRRDSSAKPMKEMLLSSALHTNCPQGRTMYPAFRGLGSASGFPIISALISESVARVSKSCTTTITAARFVSGDAKQGLNHIQMADGDFDKVMLLGEEWDPKWFRTGHDMWCARKKYFG